MNSRRWLAVTQWAVAVGALAGIVLVYRRWLHANQTTVALTLLLLILIVAARWTLQQAVVLSVLATACYNYYFLPPFDTFTISDPENWLALFAFLVTSVIGSRLSRKARDEAEQAGRRQRELQVLFTLSRELLQTENIAALVNAIPSLISQAAGAESVLLYLMEGDRLYQTGLRLVSGIEIPHYRQLALTLPGPDAGPEREMRIPLHAGVRPRGLLLISGAQLSSDSFRAIGGLVSVSLDRAQALEDLAKNEANKESERLRTLILDSITHDLRTPLTSIKGAVGALLETAKLQGSDQRELLTIVDEEADRLNRLVGQAVEMAQLEAREVHMSLAPVSPESLLKQAQEDCAWVFTAHPLTLSVPSLPRVAADAEMIRKVLCNLLENAAKYSAAGTPIFISAEEKGGSVAISVADRGVGIEPEEQSLIFDRLYRSRWQQSNVPGTGMGLAISRAIIESHGGTLTVTSQPNHGSVFTFTLPLAS